MSVDLNVSNTSRIHSFNADPNILDECVPVVQPSIPDEVKPIDSWKVLPLSLKIQTCGWVCFTVSFSYAPFPLMFVLLWAMSPSSETMHKEL